MEMDQYDVKRLALILAANAEIEGMKLANIEKESQGAAFAYSESAFFDIAEELRALVKE